MINMTPVNLFEYCLAVGTAFISTYVAYRIAKAIADTLCDD